MVQVAQPVLQIMVVTAVPPLFQAEDFNHAMPSVAVAVVLMQTQVLQVVPAVAVVARGQAGRELTIKVATEVLVPLVGRLIQITG